MVFNQLHLCFWYSTDCSETYSLPTTPMTTKLCQENSCELFCLSFYLSPSSQVKTNIGHMSRFCITSLTKVETLFLNIYYYIKPSKIQN